MALAKISTSLREALLRTAARQTNVNHDAVSASVAGAVHSACHRTHRNIGSARQRFTLRQMDQGGSR